MADKVEQFNSLHRQGLQVISQAISLEESPSVSSAASSAATDAISLYWKGISLLDQALAIQFTHAQWFPRLCSFP